MAETDLESQATTDSPDAGFNNGAIVVVVCTVVVVAMTGAGVVFEPCESAELHALTRKRAQQAKMIRFTE